MWSTTFPQLCGDENYVAKRLERECFRTVLDFGGHITGLESEHRRHLTPNNGGSFKEVLGRRLSIPASLQPCRRLVPRLLLESRGRRHDPDTLEQNYTGDASKLHLHRRQVPSFPLRWMGRDYPQHDRQDALCHRSAPLRYSLSDSSAAHCLPTYRRVRLSRKASKSFLR